MAEKQKKDNIFKKTGKYFRSLFLEMKKVNWPTRKQLVTSTISVIIYCVIVGVVIALLDTVVGTLLVDKLLGLRG